MLFYHNRATKRSRMFLCRQPNSVSQLRGAEQGRNMMRKRLRVIRDHKMHTM